MFFLCLVRIYFSHICCWTNSCFTHARSQRQHCWGSQPWIENKMARVNFFPIGMITFSPRDSIQTLKCSSWLGSIFHWFFYVFILVEIQQVWFYTRVIYFRFVSLTSIEPCWRHSTLTQATFIKSSIFRTPWSIVSIVHLKTQGKA